MYHAVDASMIRASVFSLSAPLPPWPSVDGAGTETGQWREWITQVWADDTRVAAIEFAAPFLADSVREVLSGERRRPRTLRRTAASLARYLLRMQYRATPFGLFAGPAPVRFDATVQVRWGTEHRAFVQPDAVWLNDVVTALERDPEVLRHVLVVADPTCTVRGARVSVQHQPGTDGPTETTLRRTPAVETVLAIARTPITVEEIAAQLHSDYPDTPLTVIDAMLHSLVSHRVLLTSLPAPMTCDDPLGYLMSQLDTAGVAAATTQELRQIHSLLSRHDDAPPPEQRALRAQATARMNTVTGVTDRSLVVNLRPDCDITLPKAVTREAARALDTMARVTPFPNGTPAWQDYRARFLERYSMGAVVPLRDLADPDTGLGFPVSYRGTVLKRPVLGVSLRDEHLLALAQGAALNDQRDIVLTDEDLQALSLNEPTQVPAHVELCFTVLARTLEDLNDGRFTLTTAGLSLAAGTTTGRFLTTLEQCDRERVTAVYAGLPTLAAGAVRGQVSSPPLRLRTRNVGRAPAVVANVLAVGENNPAATLDLDELGVAADAQRLYLLSLRTGQVVEPSVMNAVELSSATHPLVRFVCELHRSHTAVLLPFAWGAAERLPFLPEVRVGRTIVSAACWRLRARDVSDGSWVFWFTDWRVRYGVPRTVCVGSDDQRLRLDLDVPAHQQLLRMELERRGSVVLHEAPPESEFGWLGRAHEITVPFVSDQPAAPAPSFCPAAVVDRNSGRLPGASQRVYVKVYGNADRVTEVLTIHLPRLLIDWGVEGSDWWFVRYADPDSHLRLRMHLTSPDAFGDAASRVAVWAAELRSEGLIQRVQWDTDAPETGRYGTGPAWEAAERFFAADSAAVLAQLVVPLPDSDRPALTAASIVDIATGFLGSPESGWTWLRDNFLKDEGDASPRGVQAMAVQLTEADPNHRALRELPRGDHVAAVWALRRNALADYRQELEVAGTDPAALLPSLLHMHHNRAAGTDPAAEATCRRLARTAALSWTARTEGTKR
ncbi:lantibiotic dehydratase [Streptomyces justiciae]|uniref:lantibiotic dehydratase n=1 Tax=Streptomyces justiciae TaxID=2780140 RepID=UPI0021180CBE|nr:lantibiotic dehydratase [Streptomyces justiciae]MCW8382368.1 lantibiotic dehydratase [Streptomyces justiciae]